MAVANNNTGQVIYLTELGFPCSGTIVSEWFVSVGNMPTGLSWEFTGPLTIIDTTYHVPGTPLVPPVVYSYADLSQTGIAVPPGANVYFGYICPGIGGQTAFNGVGTWSWYQGAWVGDEPFLRTSIMQLKASFEDPVALENESFGAVKALYR